MKKLNFYIITGAPGTGKSSLILTLSQKFKTFKEPAREVIAEQKANQSQGLWDKDRSLFINLLLQKSIADFKKGSTKDRVFFDRGLPDCVAYADYGNIPKESFAETAKKYQYNPKVFLLEPWEEIYKNDEERTMSYEQTVVFHTKIVNAYEKLGYTLLKVPKISIKDRLNFILDSTKSDE